MKTGERPKVRSSGHCVFYAAPPDRVLRLLQSDARTHRDQKGVALRAKYIDVDDNDNY